MSSQGAVPKNRAAWAEFLGQKSLPVRASTPQRLRQLLERADSTLPQLESIIAQDPIFALQAIGLANRLNRNTDTDVSSLKLAVTTLGMDRIEGLAKELPVLRLNPSSLPQKRYFQAVCNSHHASVQATNLCRSRENTLINQTRLAALVYGVGHWALWRYAPQKMSEVLIHIYEDDADVVLAETDVLGCTIQEISEDLVRQWQLSQLAAEALRHDTSPDAAMLEAIHQYVADENSLEEEQRRQVRQLLLAPHYPVKLANWLALSVPFGWHRPKALRLLEIISDFARDSQSRMAARLHQHCAQASREFSIPGVLSPAALMLMLPSPLAPGYRLDKDARGQPAGALQVPAKATPPPAASTTGDAPPRAKADPQAGMRDEQTFLRIARDFKKDDSQQPDPSAVLRNLMRGLRQGLGLERICLFQVEDDELRPLGQSGFARQAALPRFSTRLSIPSLFKKLGHKPLAVWVAEHNREQIWAELPERFKQACHPSSFALISLFVNNRPAYFVYGDRGVASEQPLSETDFRAFKQLAILASRTLNRRENAD